MVVDSPRPSIPSAQRRKITTRVWRCMVCIASLCGRMVGRSTMIASMLSIRTWLISGRFRRLGSGSRDRRHRRGTAAALAADGEHAHGDGGDGAGNGEGQEIQLQRQVDAQQRTTEQRAYDGAV